VGGIDLSLNAPGLEIDDFVIRSAIGGYRTLQANDVEVLGTPRNHTIDSASAERFRGRWGFVPQPEALDAVDEAYDRDRHFKPFGAEEGYRPDARPVVVEEARTHNLLVQGPWDDAAAVGRLLKDLEKLPDHVSAWFRVPAGEGVQHRERIGEAARAAGLDPETLPELLVLDPQLAREREAGLYVAADAVYIDEAWPESELVARRAEDCGRSVIRGRDDLEAWLADLG
jgi:hypothetical protein